MMTQKDFDEKRWGANTKVTYRGTIYGVSAVNFYERLLGITTSADFDDESDDDLIWVRCESVELLP
jgi:hypothetical protein